MTTLYKPPDYPRIKLVASFDELATTAFHDGVNALCWPRVLPGDYAEVIANLPVHEGITPLEEEMLRGLPTSGAGLVAIEVMLEDLRLLRELGREPVLDCIRGYLRDEVPGIVRTDVCSFHVDSAPIEADTWLCTYHGPCSEGLRNEDALRRVEVPETRAALLKLFAGEDDGMFAEFLHENCFDLHYTPLPQAQPFPFGLHHLWRIACEYPGSPVPPCIHRAPETLPGDPARLLLIS